jgi:hypothetical protein
MGFLEWFTIITGAATLISLAIGISAWKVTKSFNIAMTATQERIHATTQQTLAGIDRTLQEMHTDTLQILDRMDQRAEARYRDLRGRINGEV